MNSWDRGEAPPERVQVDGVVPLADGTVPLALLSAALDEIYALRTILAYEASVSASHGEYKTFPKTRRRFLEEQVERMRHAARGGHAHVYSRIAYPKQALRRAGADECLTRAQWEAEQRRF